MSEEKLTFGLSKPKQDAVRTLARARDRLIQDIQREIDQINASLRDLAETFGLAFTESVIEGGRWDLASDEKDNSQVVLVYALPPEPEEGEEPSIED